MDLVVRVEVGSATLLQILLGLVADARTTGGTDGTTDYRTRRSGDRATDDSTRGTATERAGAGPGLVVALGRLTGDRPTDGADRATDDSTRRAADGGTDRCPRKGAAARSECLGTVLVGVFVQVADGTAPIHRAIHGAVHLASIEGRVEWVDVTLEAPRVVAIHMLASLPWGSAGGRLGVAGTVSAGQTGPTSTSSEVA
jgi:hypothetical protein